MILHVPLLHKIGDKLKQPYNVINLELSFSLNNYRNYFVDYYTNYYLNTANKYKIVSNGFNIFDLYYTNELKIVKYFLKRSNYYPYFRVNCCDGNLKIVKLLLIYDLNNYNQNCYNYLMAVLSIDNNWKILKVLIENYPLSVFREIYIIIKYYTENSGNKKIVKYLESLYK